MESGPPIRPETDPVLRFDHVSFSIEGRAILSDVSFTVRRGRTRVIVGPSGAGKSTILRLLLGLIRPDSGAIYVEGRDIARLGRDALDEVRGRMGMVFQEGALFDSLTVGENVAFALLNLKRHRAKRRHRSEIAQVEALRLLDLVGLDADLLDRMPDELSGGMQRRVAIARALAGSPEILLYDEPTTGLDPTSIEQVTDVMLQLRDRLHIASVVVTHHIPDALKVGDRFSLLSEGRVVFDGTGLEMLAARDEGVVDFLRPFRRLMSVARDRLAEAEAEEAS